MDADIISFAKWKIEHPPQAIKTVQAGIKCWNAWARLWWPWIFVGNDRTRAA